MARLVNTVEDQLVTCNVVTKFIDGTSSIKPLEVGSVIEGLRYIQNHEIKTVSGMIKDVTVDCRQVTPVNLANPVDYFSKDAIVTTIVVDSSTQYHSDVNTIDAREVVEDAGVIDVIKVDVTAVPSVKLEMSYTDGTTVYQDVVVGDILCDMVILTSPGKPDIVGDFRVAAFRYTNTNKKVRFTGFYLVPLSGGNGIFASFDSIIRFTEKERSDVTDSTSLGQLASALSERDEVFAFINTDVTVPLREDGKITSLFIDEGKTLTLDLNGHSINTEAYAFYVNGGTLIIRDTSGEGKITAKIPNKAYPAVYVASNGVCNMEGGTIDTTVAELHPGEDNWLYGIVCSGNGIFNMTGGRIITQDAAGLSITNGTASGEGAQFNISGTASITANDCTAIYLADNKSVNISGKATINGGVLLRMGDLNVSEKAVINGAPSGTAVYPLGKLVCESGCENHTAAILALTGCYGSDLGNDLNITIKDNAKVNAYIDNAIDIAEIDTKFDQIVNVDVKSSNNIKFVNRLWNIYDHDALATMAAAQGKNLPAKNADTTLTIDVNSEQVYPRS